MTTFRRSVRSIAATLFVLLASSVILTVIMSAFSAGQGAAGQQESNETVTLFASLAKAALFVILVVLMSLAVLVAVAVLLRAYRGETTPF